MRRFIIFIVLVCLFCISEDAFSFSLSISDPKVALEVVGGDTVTGTLKVHNPTSGEIEIRAYLEDFAYVSPYDGAKKFLPPGSTEFSCANWISFSPQEFSIPPFAKKNVDYSIRVPSDAKGSYYAVLFFETSLGKMEEEAGYTMTVMGRIGSLFFVELKDRQKQLAIKDIRIEAGLIKGKLLNLGDAFVKSETTYYVIDDDGMVIDRGKVQDIFTFPKDEASFEIELSEGVSAGRYSLICTFDLQDGDVLVREIDFLRDELGSIKILAIRE